MLSVSELQRRLQSREIDLLDYTQRVLDNAVASNSSLNCLLTVTAELALTRAAEQRARLQAGEKMGALCGVPLVIKDNICLSGYPTTCASRMLEDFVPPYTATAVQRLLAADAIPIAKANLDEFAMGSSNENSSFGAVANPRDPARVPGGSSGGCAAAVAAGLTPIALGSDTGGSVRQPAAMCGVIGLKPTYGSVSRYGLVAFASSLDQIGVLGSDLESVALAFMAISGRDDRDATSVEFEKPKLLEALKGDAAGMRLGLPRQYFGEGLSAEIAARLAEVIAFLEEQGVQVIEVDLPHTEQVIAAYYIIADAEASSNLSRYDGIRYGRRARTDQLRAVYSRSRSDALGGEVQRRIMLGTFVLSAGYYEAYYERAQKVRRLIRQDFEAAFEKVDLLLTPTTPTTAFKIGEKVDDPLSMYLADIYTAAANLAGLPAISLPCGKDSLGLPIGLQLIGRDFAEASLFRCAGQVMKVS